MPLENHDLEKKDTIPGFPFRKLLAARYIDKLQDLKDLIIPTWGDGNARFTNSTCGYYYVIHAKAEREISQAVQQRFTNIHRNVRSCY